jgi:hypothetical protein
MEPTISWGWNFEKDSERTRPRITGFPQYLIPSSEGRYIPLPTLESLQQIVAEIEAEQTLVAGSEMDLPFWVSISRILRSRLSSRGFHYLLRLSKKV